MPSLDTKITIEVRIYHERKTVTFSFSDEKVAQMFYRRNSVATLYSRYGVSMRIPSGLDYVRAGTGTPSIIFGFADEATAKDWMPESVLGHREGKEVRIKLKWNRDEVEAILGTEDEEAPRRATRSGAVRSVR